MDVGELGKEMNAALPYRETVDRVLSRTKAFLHADFAALLLLDADARAFSLEGAQGVLSPTLSLGLLRLHRPTARCARRSPAADLRAPRATPARCSRTR